MGVSERTRVPLFDVLESRGWSWEGDQLFAPRGSFAIRRHQERELPLFMLIRVHERMGERLAALRRGRPAHLSEERYGAMCDDLEALVSILGELITEARS